MLDNMYLQQLPASQILAANQICTDFLRGQLSDDENDILHILEVLLEEHLPNGWDMPLIEEQRRNHTLFYKPKINIPPRDRIRLMHRHVKALATKEALSQPRVLNPYLVDITREQATKLDARLERAREIIRSETEVEEKKKRQVMAIINRLQDQIDRKKSDYRVFLNAIIEMSDLVADDGKKLRPVYPVLRDVFTFVDTQRRRKETADAARPAIASEDARKQLPAPY